MKKTSAVYALAAFASAASAQAPNIPEPVHDWGCEVLLCLANPAGPTAVSECRPPIHKLWRHLAKGRAFPTCTMATGPEGGSYARMGYSHYDPCPPGTTALDWGERAQLAGPVGGAVPPSASNMPSGYVAAASNQTYIGIGTGDGLAAPGQDGQPPSKVCVGGYRGTRQVWTADGGEGIAAYDMIFIAQAHASPRVIDVYIDNQFWQRVRW